jgi:hypothetical protein
MNELESMGSGYPFELSLPSEFMPHTIRTVWTASVTSWSHP